MRILTFWEEGKYIFIQLYKGYIIKFKHEFNKILNYKKNKNLFKYFSVAMQGKKKFFECHAILDSYFVKRLKATYWIESGVNRSAKFLHIFTDHDPQSSIRHIV